MGEKDKKITPFSSLEGHQVLLFVGDVSDFVTERKLEVWLCCVCDRKEPGRSGVCSWDCSSGGGGSSESKIRGWRRDFGECEQGKELRRGPKPSRDF